MKANGVGARVLRKEDRRHLLGRGQFTSDLTFAGLKEVACVRSSVAHARIVSINIPDDIRSQVVLASDLPGAKAIRAVTEVAGFKPSDYPVLASQKVLFVGQPIALCIGDTRAKAEDIAQRVEIEYEELPAVFDMHGALAPDSALLHESWGDNLFIAKDFEFGDLDKVRAAAEVVVEREYKMNRQAGVSMEGRAILAYWDERLDQLTIYNSTQMPHQIRFGMSLHLGIDERQLQVIAPDVGGGFGVKNILYPEEIAVPAVARQRRHPCRWPEDRRRHRAPSLPGRDPFSPVNAHPP